MDCDFIVYTIIGSIIGLTIGLMILPKFSAWVRRKLLVSAFIDGDVIEIVNDRWSKKEIKFPYVKVDPKLLKRLRESTGYSREDIAGVLGMDVAEVEDIEDGKKHFTILQLNLLASLYERPLITFFRDEEVRRDENGDTTTL